MSSGHNRKMPAVEYGEEDDDMDYDHTDGYNYPGCMFANDGPPLNKCQGTCGRQCCFHHACNVNWVEREGVDAELRKLCFDCVQTVFREI